MLISVFDKKAKILLLYLLTMLFFYMGDSIMSFSSPVVINRNLSNTLLMGLVVSFSSMIGFLVDLFVAKFFPDRQFDFFANLMFKLVVFFPLSFILLPHKTWVFLFAMGVWGVYYELSKFTHFNFINSYLDRHQHVKAWSLISFVQTIGIVTGPLIAQRLINSENKVLVFMVAFVIFLVSYSIYSLLKHLFKKHHHQPVSQASSLSFYKEFKIWWVMLKKLWPLYFFLLSLYLLDTSLWIGGPLLMAKYSNFWYMGYLLSAYNLPTLFTIFFVSRLSKKFSKKKLAFIGAIIGGLLLSLSFMVFSNFWLIIFVFLSSAFIAVVFTEIFAVFEDYVARLGFFKNDLVGLQSSAVSLAYIIGPISVGFLVSKFGGQVTIALFGLLLATVGGMCLYIVPRKIKMPQQELEQVVKQETTTIK